MDRPPLLAASTLGVVIDLQLLQWSRTSDGRRSFAHALLMIVLELATVVPRYVWTDLGELSGVWSFWLADACAWFCCVLSALYSVHLSPSTEYPVTGWIWASAWLFAFASCGAGESRIVPVVSCGLLRLDSNNGQSPLHVFIWQSFAYVDLFLRPPISWNNSHLRERIVIASRGFLRRTTVPQITF